MGSLGADSSMAWRGLPVKGVDGTMGVWDSFWSMLKVTPESDPGASWIPRELDVGADRLSNMDGSGLTRRSGIPVETSDLSLHILEDVALSSGADVYANSGPFAREGVAFRPNGACVCAIPACPWWCRCFPKEWGCRTNPEGRGTEVPWKFRKSGKLEVPDYVLSSALDLHFATSATAAVAALQGYGRWQSEVSPQVCSEV